MTNGRKGKDGGFREKRRSAVLSLASLLTIHGLLVARARTDGAVSWGKEANNEEDDDKGMAREE